MEPAGTRRKIWLEWQSSDGKAEQAHVAQRLRSSDDPGSAGVEFIDENGGGAGVRFRKPAKIFRK